MAWPARSFDVVPRLRPNHTLPILENLFVWQQHSQEVYNTTWFMYQTSHCGATYMYVHVHVHVTCTWQGNSHVLMLKEAIIHTYAHTHVFHSKSYTCMHQQLNMKLTIIMHHVVYILYLYMYVHVQIMSRCTHMFSTYIYRISWKIQIYIWKLFIVQTGSEYRVTLICGRGEHFFPPYAQFSANIKCWTCSN